MSREQTRETREYLQGYGSAIADIARMEGGEPWAVRLLEGAGLDQYVLRDAGLEIADVGAISKARANVRKLTRAA